MARESTYGIDPRIVWILLILLILILSAVRFMHLELTSALFGMAAVIFFFLAFSYTELALYLLVFSMLLSPEFAVGAAGGGGGLEAGRAVVVRLDDVLLVILALAWFARTAVYKELGLTLKTELNRPIYAYIIICAASTILGILWGNVRLKLGFFYVVRYIEYFVIYFMTVNYIQTEKQIKRLIVFAFIAAGLIAIYGMMQIPAGTRVSAPFEGESGEPNTLGGYLVFMLSLTLGVLLKGKRPGRVIALLMYSLILLIPLIFTGSRASWLALIPMVIVFFILSERKKTILAFVLVAAILGPLFLPSNVIQRITYTWGQSTREAGLAERTRVSMGGMKLDTSASARLRSWREGIEGWKRHPIFGWGVTGFKFMDAQYIRALVETGALGLFIFLWLLRGYYRVGMRSHRLIREGTLGGITMGYVAGVFVLAMHSIGSNTFIILRIMEPFMLFTGIVVSLIRLRSEAQPEPEKRPSEPSQKRVGGTRGVVYPRTIDLIRESRKTPRRLGD